jgi:ring-1,2-phenylacetyl-CoA epoxidase subunit PaaA
MPVFKHKGLAMTLPLVDALQSEEAVLTRLRKQQLIESVEQMSPIYLEGMKRILTVSAD